MKAVRKSDGDRTPTDAIKWASSAPGRPLSSLTGHPLACAHAGSSRLGLLHPSLTTVLRRLLHPRDVTRVTCGVRQSSRGCGAEPHVSRRTWEGAHPA